MSYIVKIREATSDDLDGILAVEYASFREDQFSARQFSYLISHSKGAFYVAQSESGGEIVGYISLLQRSGSNNLRIYSVAVHPAARGHNTGQMLLDKAFEYARSKNITKISLEVKMDNVIAVNLYRKNGFESKYLLRNYYGAGWDAFRMIYSELK